MTSIVALSERASRPVSQPKLEYRGTSNQHSTSTHVAAQSQTHINKPVARYNDIRLVSEITTIRKGIKLGSGGFAYIFRAVQIDTQRIVALKQCRASLRLKRSLLQHEARVLKILSGHPNIPEVYAYGRIQHFELMSMQLLHRSLGDVVKEDGSLSVKVVANLACQMMDALQHVHSHGLVHRDIKPDNIMLQNAGSWQLCLIDFGLTRPLPDSRIPTKYTTREDSNSTSDRPAYVFGTLPFASLNAHEKDSQLTFRDDLESLAYTLLWLLRESLPWSHYAKCGTRVGRIRQVFAQKKRHTGSTMATGLPAEFGRLVDYARSLSLDEKPEYEAWRRQFKQVESTASAEISKSGPRVPQASTAPPKPPVEVGQIVLVKLNPSVTADGYTIREGHESSFIPDPIFDGPEWSMTYRPAVVARVEWDQEIRKYQFLAIAISRKSDRDTDVTTPVIPITATSSDTSSTSPTVHIEPRWPFEDSYFYVFRRPERVHSTWRVTPSDCDILLNAFTPPPDTFTRSQLRADLKSPDTDIRHDARMQQRDGYCNLYAQVHPLTLAHIGDDSIDWFSRRAWFDECVKVTRYQSLNLGIWWTGAWFPAEYQRREGEVTDSYSEPDYSMWEPQSERRKSITLSAITEDVGSSGEVLAGLTNIIGLEQEPETGDIQRDRV